jgi:crotonobetainyl-CoA:carnitine CoA-transferase CaiB-like acyl-CoA transferase
MILADQGADVIKFEAEGGDFTRHVATRRGGYSAAFLNNNRNKRSIVLDLKSDQGRDALLKMVVQSDVFVQNFRPGVAQRLGFGEDALMKLNTRLVYMSIAGVGLEGPLADRPVYDPLIQAISSLASVQAGSDADRPRVVRTILTDKLTGIQASQAITAALFSRERTGKGQAIRLSMPDTIVFFLCGSDMGGHTFVGDELLIEEAQSFIDLIYAVTDGYVSVTIMQDKHRQSFVTAVGQSDLLADPRFTTPELREVNRDARLQATQDAIAGTPAPT